MKRDESRPNIRAGNLSTGKIVKDKTNNQKYSNKKSFNKSSDYNKANHSNTNGKANNNGNQKGKANSKPQKKQPKLNMKFVPRIGVKPDDKFVFVEEGGKCESDGTGYAKVISNAMGNPKRPIYVYPKHDIQNTQKKGTMIFHVTNGDYVASVEYHPWKSESHLGSLTMYIFVINKSTYKCTYKPVFYRKIKITDPDFENSSNGIFGKCFDNDLKYRKQDKLIPLANAACSKAIMPKMIYSYQRASRLVAKSS